jgi:hypothetical protein
MKQTPESTADYLDRHMIEAMKELAKEGFNPNKKQTMKQQTAVGWLEEEIKDLFQKEGKLPLANTLHLINQALIVERKQLSEAWNDGNLLGRNGNIIEEYSTGEAYILKKYR